ncbi:MAG: 3-dehydroquinate synthase [Xanthomonadaceae bacterium]|nr:3-dehydroquinate synthase [Xanthomonadaceae bacterium]
MRTLNVDLGARSYPIYIGTGLLRADLIAPHIPGRHVLIVTNDSIAPLYLERAQAMLSGFDTASLVLPDGERHKTLETVSRIYDVLLQRRMDRQTTLIALGGGVIGDMVGFAAATYQRGVHFIQIPTTLLAQVDSSVGGKTGVNHPLGKNMIGAFYQPRAVLADMDTLTTLPPRELRAGLAEVIKYGLIMDAEFLDWLEGHMPQLLAMEHDALAVAVERSCRNKAAVVGCDEREAGERALLNLGHTFGHAIETATGYESWLHGEAVAAGMHMAAYMSQELGWLSAAEVERVRQLLLAAELPVRPPAIAPERFRELMAVDKKALAGRLRLVLLKALGRAVVTAEFDDAALTRTLQHFASAG